MADIAAFYEFSAETPVTTVLHHYFDTKICRYCYKKFHIYVTGEDEHVNDEYVCLNCTPRVIGNTKANKQE